MSDLEKMMQEIEEKVNGAMAKVKVQLDGIESKINSNLKKYGFGWDEKPEKPEKPERPEKPEEPTKHAHSTGSTEKRDREKTDKNDFSKKIEEIAPYLDEDTLDDAVQQFIEGELQFDMNAILPYLSENGVSMLFRKLGECENGEYNGITLYDVLPYADDFDIGEVFKRRVKRGIIDKEMMPYVDDDCWHELVKEYCNNEDSKLNIDEAYPYLDDEDLALLFKTYLKRRKKG